MPDPAAQVPCPACVARVQEDERRASAEDATAERHATWAQRGAWGLLATGVVLLLATGVASVVLRKWEWPGTAGPVGDFFGGHLSGFGNLAAFLMMFAALTLQRRELALQRRELELSRDESAKQTTALDEQHDALVKAYEAAEKQAAAMLEAQKRQAEEVLRARVREVRQESIALAKEVGEELLRWVPKSGPEFSLLKQRLDGLHRVCRELVHDLRNSHKDPERRASPEALLDQHEEVLADLRSALDTLVVELHALRVAESEGEDS